MTLLVDTWIDLNGAYNKEWHVRLWHSKGNMVIGLGWQQFVIDLDIKDGSFIYTSITPRVRGRLNIRVFNNNRVERWFVESKDEDGARLAR